MMIAPLRDIFDAARGSRLGRLADATALIQRTLQGRAAPSGAQAAPSAASEALDVGPALRGLVASFKSRAGRPGTDEAAAADGARFITATFTNQAGSRPYKVYVPASYRGKPVPLIVMLHGCTQSPDDFAAGTRMNEAAEAHGCIVVYPGQIAAANSSKCWNWFNAGDQARDRGEPSLVAGIAREVMGRYAIAPRRVYVAGLSAGGAAAAVLGHAYPDLFAAVGVHSGLACGAARDMASAFMAMRQGGTASAPAGGPHRPRPTIVFHGDSDGTVNPVNGRQVIERAMPSTKLTRKEAQGQVTGGRAYSVVTYEDADGRAVAEQWVVHGGAHAWSGGSPSGSYTDPGGPDATREMVRFFLQHENAEAA